MMVGVMLPNWIGDVVMATPALRALRSHFGSGTTMVGIMRPYVVDVLAGTGWLDREVVYDRHSPDRGLRIASLIQKLRSMRLDTMLLLTNSLRAGGVAALSGARRRVGYARNGRGILLTQRIQPPIEGWKLSPVSAVDYYLELASAIGCPPGSRCLELATSVEDERRADEVLCRIGLAGSDRVVLLNTGGAYGAAKHWPEEYYARLAQQIADVPRTSVLILCGPAERRAAANIEQLASHPQVRSLASETVSLGLTKACIRRGQLMITTDSGPRHIAAALGVPVIALFGPTDPKWSINYHPAEIRLQKDMLCRPCRKRICPLGHHRCMRELTVDKVFDAAQSMLMGLAPKAA